MEPGARSVLSGTDAPEAANTLLAVGALPVSHHDQLERLRICREDHAGRAIVLQPVQRVLMAKAPRYERRADTTAPVLGHRCRSGVAPARPRTGRSASSRRPVPRSRQRGRARRLPRCTAGCSQRRKTVRTSGRHGLDHLCVYQPRELHRHRRPADRGDRMCVVRGGISYRDHARSLQTRLSF
jgi:hypothetical protein